MYCKNCGKEINENMKFCPACGAPVEQEPPKPPKKKKSKWWIILIVIVVVIAGAVATMLALKQNKQKKYETSLEQGDKYLEELDYENAEAKYLAAIEIEPKEKEPYMKLADIYMSQEKPEKAVKILEKGIKNTEDKELQERYDLYTYVEKVLIPEIGQCEEGEYTCNYTQTSGYLLESVHDQQGVMTWNSMDYDNDGEEELLVLVMKNQEHMRGDDNNTYNGIYLQMYESESGDVVQKDEYRCMYPVMGFGDTEADSIFLKKVNDKIYICGSSDSLTWSYADGSTITSFIVSYENEKFVKEAAVEEPMQGSDFSGHIEVFDIADAMDRIGMINSAKTVRNTYIPIFGSNDTVDKMLVKITGKNEGFDRNKWMSDYEGGSFGKVVVKLQLSGFAKDEKPAAFNTNEIFDSIMGDNSSVNESANEKNTNNNQGSLTKDEVMKAVGEHYNEQLTNGGAYMIFTDESVETDTGYIIYLRYMMSEEEENELLAAGGTPGAYSYAAEITVDTVTGKVTSDAGDTWNLYE